MPTKIRFFAFALTCSVGIGSTFFSSIFQQKGFSQEEVQAKIGKRVKLIADVHSTNPKIINSGVVTYAQVDRGERKLVIEFDEKLPGWNSHTVWASRKAYQEVIVEE